MFKCDGIWVILLQLFDYIHIQLTLNVENSPVSFCVHNFMLCIKYDSFVLDLCLFANGISRGVHFPAVWVRKGGTGV